MIDREKVIKGLECCHNKTMLWQHDQCPYHGFDEDCESNLHADALVLLKEQEADMIALKNAYKELAEKGSVIVRCKDCRHRGTMHCYCNSWQTVKDDWFCADGVKKDD